MANATAEITWLMFLLSDIGLYLAHLRTLFCDILFALHLTVNLVFHVRTKYVKIDYHFVRKKKWRLARSSLVTSPPNLSLLIF